MDKIGCEMICKSHSARSERDNYRICPTKLSKTELEDLYFALLENNLQLKKTINVQQDKIKVLTTKVQRMTSAQNVLRAEENKSCCAATKAVVQQQKDMITELTRANERMADRVRKLNMRLCSAKQFCKSATPRGLRCSTATSPYLIKHSPCSYKQQSHSTLKLAVSCQNLSRETFVTKYVQTEPCDTEKIEEENKACEDNKCKSLIDELQERIIELKEKLSHTQRESESELQRSRAERAAAQHELQRAEHKNATLTTSLRTAEGHNCELKMQLSIEKRRVAELETRLKAATMSSKVTKNIEDTLASIQESNRTEMAFTCTCCSPRSKMESSSQQTYLSVSANEGNTESKLAKSTDDSGYMDTKSQVFLDDQSLNKIIEELTKRIMVLQTQVDALTISPPETAQVETKVSSSVAEENDTNTVIEHLTTKENSTKKTPFNQTTAAQIQISDTEMNGAKPANSDEEHKMIPSLIPSPESSHSDHWVGNETQMKVDNKSEENNDTVKEATEEIKNNEEVTENLEDYKDSRHRKENIKTDTIRSVHDENKEKKLNKSSSTEDKTYNISDKNGARNKRVKKVDSVNDNESLGSRENVKGKSNVDSPRKLCKNKTKTERNERRSTKNLLINTEKERPKPVEKLTTFDRADTQKVSTCEEATYTVEGDSSRPTSPDNTDYEISSITDLTEEREFKNPNCYLSPGERKFPLSRSDSYATPSTIYSLSEGEVHVTSVRRRSCDDKPRVESERMITAPKMEETLQAITEELARCKRLLFSQKS